MEQRKASFQEVGGRFVLYPDGGGMFVHGGAGSILSSAFDGKRVGVASDPRRGPCTSGGRPHRVLLGVLGLEAAEVAAVAGDDDLSIELNAERVECLEVRLAPVVCVDYFSRDVPRARVGVPGGPEGRIRGKAIRPVDAFLAVEECRSGVTRVPFVS
jgi:hypothetical protein